MANVDKVTVDDKQFTVFRRLPIPISRSIEKKLIGMADGFNGDLNSLQGGNVDLKSMKGINMDDLYEIHDELLCNAVISPKITENDINDINHDLQPYFKELAELLLERYTSDKEAVKKKLNESSN